MEHIHKTVQQKKDECIALLCSTKRDKIEDLISHITRMGYFEAPGSYSITALSAVLSAIPWKLITRQWFCVKKNFVKASPQIRCQKKASLSQP